MMHFPQQLASLTTPEQAAAYAKLDPKLVSAAHEFEASMMQELLKPMQSGSLFGSDSGDNSAGGIGSLTSSEDDSASALISFGSEAMARALSEKGGLGIAKRILDHFQSGEAGGKIHNHS